MKLKERPTLNWVLNMDKEMYFKQFYLEAMKPHLGHDP